MEYVGGSVLSLYLAVDFLVFTTASYFGIAGLVPQPSYSFQCFVVWHLRLF